jgi:nucleoside-diphosphate-sugar epimerase
MSDVFIAGCGDIGLRIAAISQAHGLRVTGLVSRRESSARLQAADVMPVVADLDAQVPALPDLRDATVFYLAPPARQGDDDARLRNFLQALRSARVLVYLSTSAVYGDCGGAWVDETAAVNPGSARGRRRAAAETHALAWGQAQGMPVKILRVPGIYGPGRLPVERLQRGLPVLHEADSPWTNRIHADDLAQAAVLIAGHGEPAAAYNVSDGNPTTMSDYFNRCADLLGLPRPPQVALAEARTRLTPEMMSFLEESKRLGTRRLRALGWAPRYPTLAEGLPTCL